MEEKYVPSYQKTILQVCLNNRYVISTHAIGRDDAYERRKDRKY